MVVRLVALFIVIALAEMATFLWVGSQIGFPWALGIALVTAVIGSILVSRAGISVIQRIQERSRQGRLPGRELSDGAVVLVAGAFLISPGFITDMLGFLLLVPGVRGMVYRQVSSRLSRRITLLGTGRVFPHRGWVEAKGEIIDIEPDD